MRWVDIKEVWPASSRAGTNLVQAGAAAFLIILRVQTTVLSLD